MELTLTEEYWIKYCMGYSFINATVQDKVVPVL
jgi:hypothetical protein